MIDEYQKHQLQHKRIPRDVEFYDELGTPVTYQIQHEDNPNDTCNDFYPIKYKRGKDEKILRLQKDGEDFTVSSMLDQISDHLNPTGFRLFPNGKIYQPI